MVKDAASLQVRFSADRPDEWVADAAVAWVNPEVDLAVLALVPEPDTGPVAPLAFGLVADEDHTLTCSAVGFPAPSCERTAFGDCQTAGPSSTATPST
ncbi:hypothetical protein GCM10029963_07850 [Micromonospora andamanensis]